VADEPEVKTDGRREVPGPGGRAAASRSGDRARQLTPATSNKLGSKGSATGAPTTSDGPPFDTTIVYVTL